MTLNDLERRNSPYFAFFSPNSIALLAYFVTVVEDRPIMSVKYCLAVQVFHFWPKLTHRATRSLCDSWATCSLLSNRTRYEYVRQPRWQHIILCVTAGQKTPHAHYSAEWQLTGRSFTVAGTMFCCRDFAASEFTKHVRYLYPTVFSDIQWGRSQDFNLGGGVNRVAKGHEKEG